MGCPAAWKVQARDSQRSTTFGFAASPGAPMPDVALKSTGTPDTSELSSREELQRLRLPVPVAPAISRDD